MLYSHTGGFMNNPMNIAAFIQHVRQGNNQGPIPFLRGQTTNEVETNRTAIVPIATANNLTRAVGLITCASVIYVSTAPNALAIAYLHHANAGYLAPQDIIDAGNALGNPPWNTILVIFAHPKATDKGYADSITSLIAQGIPNTNIVEIENLITGCYGINNLGQIG